MGKFKKGSAIAIAIVFFWNAHSVIPLEDAITPLSLSLKLPYYI